jgi:hypothetical protein
MFITGKLESTSIQTSLKLPGAEADERRLCACSTVVREIIPTGFVLKGMVVLTTVPLHVTLYEKSGSIPTLEHNHIVVNFNYRPGATTKIPIVCP